MILDYSRDILYIFVQNNKHKHKGGHILCQINIREQKQKKI